MAKDDPELVAAQFRDGMKTISVVLPDIARFTRMMYDEFIKTGFDTFQALRLAGNIINELLFSKGERHGPQKE